MAWILGTTDDEGMEYIKSIGYEAVLVSKEQEQGLFGGLRVDDEDKMIMVHMDMDADDMVDMFNAVMVLRTPNPNAEKE